MARSVGVPVTHRMSVPGCRSAKRSAATRASVDLPTPSGPNTTAPRGLSAKAASSRSEAVACWGTFHRIGTAEFYGVRAARQGESPRYDGLSAVGLPLADMPGEHDSSGEWSVCVYCASGPRHPELLGVAAELGEGIAERGWTLVWGGGRVSAMGAVASAARARGGRTVGVIPKVLMRREIADADADELIVSDSMHER